MKALIIIAATVAATVPAAAQEWSFFDAPVKIERKFYQELGEGNLMTGVTMSDGADKYDIICMDEMELGGALPGSFIRYSDSFIQEIEGTPDKILQDERGNSWTTLQWAEACHRMGMVR